MRRRALFSRLAALAGLLSLVACGGGGGSGGIDARGGGSGGGGGPPPPPPPPAAGVPDLGPGADLHGKRLFPDGDPWNTPVD